MSVRKIQRGYGNAERPVTSVLWGRDSRFSETVMRARGDHDPDNPAIDYTRYYDPEFAKIEFERLWSRTWLFACREEDIPEVGDRVPFDIGALSLFIVRSEPDRFQAFYNSCRHRGTKLCTAPGGGASIRCPYHAWEWKLDGSLQFIPSHWDFRSVDPKNGGLREVLLDRWAGFVFVNLDRGAPPLAEALSVIPAHFAGYDLENRYTAGRLRKLVRANWKTCQEAFQESYHVIGTHPEAIPYNGDSQAQYDIWSGENGHVGRQVTPSAVPSMHAGADADEVSAAYAYAEVARDWHYPEFEMPTIDPGRNVRTQIADWHRRAQEKYFGNVLALPDAIMVDSILYFMFPSFTIWLSETLPFTYRFLPHEDDPNMSYLEVRLLRRYPQGTPRPPSAPVIEVGPDESVVEKAPVFGALGVIFDQDMDNMPKVQQGMRAADPERHHSMLGTYQEAIIQHWHKVLDKYVEG
jgi:phenylpropionate dioxygenase-like ring-hydroxylating dioxygenase large terminal subunit